MAKRSTLKNSAGEEKYESETNRKTLQIEPDVHTRLTRFCGPTLKYGRIVNDAMDWLLEEPDLLEVIVNRGRITSERMRQAYCGALKSLASEVCGENVSGGATVSPGRDSANQ